MRGRAEAVGPAAEPPRPRRVLRPARPFLASIPDDLRALRRYAGLFRAMAATRLKVRYRHSALGWLWAVLQPLALMLLYAAVFSRVAGFDAATTVPYPLFVMAGLLPWSFCSTAIGTAVGGFLSHHALMAKVYFPREIVPLSYLVVALFDLAVASVVLLALMLLHGATPPATALLAVPVVAVLVLHAGALCLLLSAVQVRVRDVGVALPLLLQVLVFTAPVVYPASMVPERLQPVYWANPLAILVDAFRHAVVEGGVPDAGGLLYSAVSGGVVFLFAWRVFKRTETRIVDEM
jgi:lipopolysaccharide transport system permease protein